MEGVYTDNNIDSHFETTRADKELTVGFDSKSITPPEQKVKNIRIGANKTM